VLVRPPWGLVARATFSPEFRFETDYVILLVTIIGTTVAPWQQFYQQSAIADKGLKPRDYKYELVDVAVGVLYAVAVVGFIVVTCADTLFASGVRIETAKDAAVALHPLAGQHAATLFALGLLNASLLSSAVLPLSTAYVVCEAFGWESGISHSLKEAPAFFGIHAALIVLGAGVILLPIRSLVQTMMASQTLNGVILPIVMIVMLRLVSDRGLLGKFANSRLYSILAWIIVVALIALTVVLLVTTLFPQFL
jgi:Mn2+/Fe2+ NRAMP family transporter